MATVFGASLSDMERQAELIYMESVMDYSKIEAIQNITNAQYERAITEAEYTVLKTGGTYDDYERLVMEAAEAQSEKKVGIIRTFLNAIGKTIASFGNWIQRALGAGMSRADELQDAEIDGVKFAKVKEATNKLPGVLQTAKNIIQQITDCIKENKKFTAATVGFAAVGLALFVRGSKEEKEAEKAPREKVPRATIEDYVRKWLKIQKDAEEVVSSGNKLLDLLRSGKSMVHDNIERIAAQKNAKREAKAAAAAGDGTNPAPGNESAVSDVTGGVITESDDNYGLSSYDGLFLERKNTNKNKNKNQNNGGQQSGSNPQGGQQTQGTNGNPQSGAQGQNNGGQQPSGSTGTNSNPQSGTQNQNNGGNSNPKGGQQGQQAGGNNNPNPQSGTSGNNGNPQGTNSNPQSGTQGQNNGGQQSGSNPQGGQQTQGTNGNPQPNANDNSGAKDQNQNNDQKGNDNAEAKPESELSKLPWYDEAIAVLQGVLEVIATVVAAAGKCVIDLIGAGASWVSNKLDEKNKEIQAHKTDQTNPSEEQPETTETQGEGEGSGDEQEQSESAEEPEVEGNLTTESTTDLFGIQNEYKEMTEAPSLEELNAFESLMENL